MKEPMRASFESVFPDLSHRALRALPPAMHGKARLARLMLGRNLERKDVWVEDSFGIRYVVPSLKESIAFHLLIDGVYEPVTMRFLRQYLKPDSIFLDIGANIGVFALPLSKVVGPQGRVIAVEASPTILPYLQKNRDANDCANVCVKPYAAYESDKELAFYEAPSSAFGMGALAPRFNAPAVSVPGRTIDGILAEEGLSSVDVVKIDAEGFEASVFRGAKKMLSGPRAPLIVFEFNETLEAPEPGGSADNSQRLLSDQGYAIWRVANFMKGGKPLKKAITGGLEMLVASKVRAGHER